MKSVSRRNKNAPRRRLTNARDSHVLPRAKRILRAPLFQKNGISAFCRRWKIRELAVFGSALRKDFRVESDLDLLATFDPDAMWSLLDHVRMQDELQALFQRKIDLISKRALARSPNWIIRNEILRTAQIVYSETGVMHGA